MGVSPKEREKMTQYAPGGGSFSAQATELFVDGNYTGSQNNGSINAPFATITAALAAAAAGDTIKIKYVAAGYTEDLTLVDGVHLAGESGPRGDSPLVTGTATATDVGCSIKNMAFIDDTAGNAVYVTGTAAETITFENCLFTGTVTGGSPLECDNTSGIIVANNCQFVMTTGNAAEVIRMESGTLNLFDCVVNHADNTSESLVAEGDAATTIRCDSCSFQGSVASEAAVANPAMTLKSCGIVVGAVSGVIVAAANTVQLLDCEITSSDAANDAIDGAGTVTLSDLRFLSTADEIATTVTVTHFGGSRMQTGKYVEAAGAGTRAITLPQVFPSTSYVVLVTYEDTGTGAQASSNEIDTIATTGFNLTTQGNGTYHWLAIHD